MLELCAVKPNYYALCICILANKVPDDTFYDMGLAMEKVKARDTAEDINGMKRTMTWKEIGDMFGISGGAAYRRAKRHSKRGGMTV